MNVTSYSATVQWVTPYLAYTQEQYSVKYGTARESLNQSSAVLSSASDISASNSTYSIPIQDLTPNTFYYIQLHSMNTYGEITSSIMTFTTAEAGKFNYLRLLYNYFDSLITGPSSPPTDFRVVATSSDTVDVSWSPPPQDAQNGIIITYTLTCQPEELDASLPTTYPAAGNYSLSGSVLLLHTIALYLLAQLGAVDLQQFKLLLC